MRRFFFFFFFKLVASVKEVLERCTQEASGNVQSSDSKHDGGRNLFPCGETETSQIWEWQNQDEKVLGEVDTAT